MGRDELDDRPRYRKKAPKRNRYGIEQWSCWSKKWCHRQWYVTAKARDQAFEDLTTKTTILRDTPWDTPFRKVDR